MNTYEVISCQTNRLETIVPLSFFRHENKSLFLDKFYGWNEKRPVDDVWNTCVINMMIYILQFENLLLYCSIKCTIVGWRFFKLKSTSVKRDVKKSIKTAKFGSKNYRNIILKGQNLLK